MLSGQFKIFSFILLFILCCSSIGAAATIDVGQGYSYTTIASGLAAANAGDRIHVHSGTYTITSTLQPSKNNLVLYGDGYQNTVIRGDTTSTFHYDGHDKAESSMLWISNLNGFEVYGFKFHGMISDNTTQHDTYGGTGDGGEAITVRYSVSNVKIHDCYFTLLHGDPIFGGASSYVDVYNCQMLRPGHDGIQLWGATNWNITNCIIDRQTNSGIRIASSSSNIKISRLTIYSTLGGGYGDIQWQGAGSGNSVDHCVFQQKATPVIVDHSGSGTMGFTNNICHGVTLPTSPVGSLTLSPYSGNSQTSSVWDWVSDGYGYDSAGVDGGGSGGDPTGGDPIPTAVYNGTPAITLTSPANGTSTTTTNGCLTFSWSNVNSTSYRLVVANNSSFAAGTILYNQTTSATAVSVSIPDGTTCYWKVQGKIDTTGAWTAYTGAASVAVTGDTVIAVTSGVYGYVYDTDSEHPISGAVVTLLNDSWSASDTTGPDGYFEFSVPRGSGVYYLRASATDYQTSPDLLPLNLTGEYVYQNIALTKAPDYFVPHYVTLTVTDIFGNLYENVSVTVYEPTDLNTPRLAGYTDSSGSVTFALNQTTMYTIVLYDVNQNINRVLTLSPMQSTYNLWVWGAHKVDNNQANVTLTPNVTSDHIRYIFNYSAYNLTYYSANVSIGSLDGVPISSYNITIWRINENNGTRMMVNNSSAYYNQVTGSGNVTVTFIVPGNGTYVIQSRVIDPDYDATKEVYFYSKFYANDNPIRPGYQWFDWAEQWHYTFLAYCLMLMAGGLFGRANASVGALMVGFIGMFSWYTGWIQYSLGDQIMATFGILILIIYLLSKKD